MLIFPALALLFLMVTAAAGQAPADLPAGRWEVAPVGGGVARSICLGRGIELLTGGRPAGQCRMTVVSSDADSQVIRWRCPAGLSGSTTLRRDAGGLFTVDIQGIERGLPFASREEWRHGGAC